MKGNERKLLHPPDWFVHKHSICPENFQRKSKLPPLATRNIISWNVPSLAMAGETKKSSYTRLVPPYDTLPNKAHQKGEKKESLVTLPQIMQAKKSTYHSKKGQWSPAKLARPRDNFLVPPYESSNPHFMPASHKETVTMKNLLSGAYQNMWGQDHKSWREEIRPKEYRRNSKKGVTLLGSQARKAHEMETEKCLFKLKRFTNVPPKVDCHRWNT